ncbi:tail protein X [Enterobacter roggenkampii]|uniref:tail protein X n=1 Tax=Enterobacter roggenkampii TaxID=1812935 RepID=UPI002237E662|nr:tail protein X [Enterobacter roggenkampii]MCW5003545.1 tail protein X [Enterobacter roggenkampii]
MPTYYTTRDGDMLDAICSAHYGTALIHQTVARVLEANPGLAARGDVYRAGMRILLPDFIPEPEADDVQLWS